MENHHQHVIRVAGVIAGVLLLGFAGAGETASRQEEGINLPSSAILWQPGDIVFRRGVGPEAGAVRAVDSSGYTHVGMIVGAYPDWQVIHAEPEEGGTGGKVEVIPLRRFMDRDHATDYGVYRVSQADEEQRSRALQNAMSRIGMPFDDGYSFRDEASFYCTELVAKAYRSVKLEVADWHAAIRPVLMDEPILTPAALLQSGKLVKLG